MKIAIIGAGQVGMIWADAIQGLQAHTVELVDPFASDRARSWAAEHAVPLHSSPAAVHPATSIALVCVPGSTIGDAVAGLLESLSAGAVIVDMSTAAAQAKRDGATAAEAIGVSYVDLAITGAVAVHGARTPLLYAGDEAVAAIELLDAVGAPFSRLDDSRPGDAVTVKLLRSVIMKGLEALALEALPAAREYGVLDQLFAALGDVGRSPFSALLSSMVVTHPQHARRRHAEVLEAAAQLEAISFGHVLTDAVGERYRESADRVEDDGGPTEPTLASTLDWLSVHAGARREECVR